MPTQQVTKLKRQGREVVVYRDAKGRTRTGFVRAVTARPVDPPVFALTPSASGGTLADGTYYYRVSVVTTGAESIAAAEKSAVVVAGGGAGSVSIATTPVAGATAYKYYGRSTGAELLLVSQAGATYVDTGAATPAGALPTLAKSLVTFDNASSGVTAIASVPQATTMRGSATRYFKRFGAPAGYTPSARS